MKIEWRHVDWEPLSISLHPSASVTRADLSAIEAFAHAWLQTRADRSDCPCRLSYFAGEIVEDTNEIQLSVEWMCERCVDALLAALDKQFPGRIESAGIGTPEIEKIIPSSFFIAIPSQVVTFEDGREEAVSDFAISNRPVSVGQFDRFVQATGYVSTAIRDGKESTYKDNYLVEFAGDIHPAEVPASFISFLDAQAYCRWAGMSLPSEAEWLAAALLDDRTYSPVEKTKHFGKFAPRLDGLNDDSLSWTKDHIGELVIMRCGPFMLKVEGWECDVAINRVLMAESECVGVFYVCRPPRDGDIPRKNARRTDDSLE